MHARLINTSKASLPLSSLQFSAWLFAPQLDGLYQKPRLGLSGMLYRVCWSTWPLFCKFCNKCLNEPLSQRRKYREKPVWPSPDLTLTRGTCPIRHPSEGGPARDSGHCDIARDFSFVVSHFPPTLFLIFLSFSSSLAREGTEGSHFSGRLNSYSCAKSETTERNSWKPGKIAWKPKPCCAWAASHLRAC